MSRRTLLTLALCAGMAGGPAAHADSIISARPIQNGIGIELGGIMNTGMSEYGSSETDIAPNTQGVVIRDRNGMTSRMVIGLVIAIAGAMAASGPKSVETNTYTSGNYVITETKTTYYSEEEKRQMNENTSKAVEGLFSAKYSDFELHLYSRDLFNRGDTSGYKANFFVGTGSDTLGFETGMGFGQANSLVDDPTHGMVNVKWSYLGMPFRVTAVKGPLRFALTFEWNWLKYGLSDNEKNMLTPVNDSMGQPTGTSSVHAGSHPWHFEVSTALMKRIALSAGITAQHLKPELGYFATAGLFF